MSDVKITIEAKDRVSAALNSLQNKLEDVNKAFKKTEQQSKETSDKMKDSFKSTGESLTTLGRGMQTVGGGLTKYITKPVLGLGMALAGLTLAKGFARMQEIDNARVKIQAMGKDFESIKNAANDAVTDTAFSLSEAMTAGASAAAAGVKEADMGDYLKTVANHAAVAGVSFDEMGTVFNKVMANGKLQAEEWNMMTDRGIDMFGAFRKATGKTNEEIIEMRKNGELTSDVFMEAMQNAYDDADIAKTIGSSTIAGAARNVVATLSRIGAALLGDTENGETFAGKLLPLLNSLKDAMKQLIPLAEEVGKQFSEMIGPAMDNLTTFFQGIADGSTKLDATKAKLGAIAGVAVTALGPALTIAGKAIAAIGTHGGIGKVALAFGKIAPAVLKVAGPIGLVVAAIAGMWANSEAFRNSVITLFSELGTTLMQTFQSVAEAFGPVMSEIMSVMSEAMGVLGDALAPVIEALIPVVQSLVSAIGQIAVALAPVIGAAARVLAAGIKMAAGIISALTPLFSLLARLATWLSGKIGPAAQTAGSIMSSAMNAAAGAINRVAGAIQSVVSWWNNLHGGTKNFNINVNKSSSGGGITGGQGGSGHPKSATGTRSAKGGMTLVGERGPEMVNLPMGASVHTARETEKMLGGNNVTVNMNGVTIAQQGLTIEQIAEGIANILEEKMSSSAEGAI